MAQCAGSSTQQKFQNFSAGYSCPWLLHAVPSHLGNIPSVSRDIHYSYLLHPHSVTGARGRAEVGGILTVGDF